MYPLAGSLIWGPPCACLEVASLLLSTYSLLAAIYMYAASEKESNTRLLISAVTGLMNLVFVLYAGQNIQHLPECRNPLLTLTLSRHESTMRAACEHHVSTM